MVVSAFSKVTEFKFPKKVQKKQISIAILLFEMKKKDELLPSKFVIILQRID